MSIDYSELNEITVKSQDELDAIPLDFKGGIYIEFGTYYTPAIVRNKYYRTVEARGNSSVVAWGNSSVVADGNTQIVDRLRGGKIEITGNARIVYMPKTIDEYCSFYGIKRTKKKGKFFKAVRKSDTGEYFSDKDWDFLYVIGKKAKADFLTEDTREDCGHGIHIAHLNWCLDYGKDWNNLAILEVEVELDKIIVPDNCPGKVRCLEVKVLREVPLEECGIYGKMIANRLNKVRE